MLNVSPEAYISSYWKLKYSYTLEKEVYFFSVGMEPPRCGRPKNTKRNAMANR